MPEGHTVLAAGILLSGSTYNGTTIVVDGTFKLKASGGASNFGRAWVGIIVKDSDNVTVFVRDSDGNRSNQPSLQWIHILGFAGTTNSKVPYFVAREIRGDGIYVGQSDWLSNSTNCSKLSLGKIIGYNSADDGRNLVSIISCDDWTLDSLDSYQIGGNVGALMPGGLDIEPDHAYQSVKRGKIGTVRAVTAGTSGLAIQGIAGTNVTTNITVESATVINTAAPSLGSGDVPGVLSQTDNGPLIRNSQHVAIELRSYFTNAYGNGVTVTNSDYVKVKGTASHCRSGANIAISAEDVSGTGVRYSEIDVAVDDISRYGFQVGKVTKTKIKGSARAPVTGYYTSSLFGVIAILHAQTDCEYSVDVEASPSWVRSYRNDATTPATFTRSGIRDCNLQGTWAGVLEQVGDMQIPRYNVRGVTDRPAMLEERNRKLE